MERTTIAAVFADQEHLGGQTVTPASVQGGGRLRPDCRRHPRLPERLSRKNLSHPAMGEIFYLPSGGKGIIMVGSIVTAVETQQSLGLVSNRP